MNLSKRGEHASKASPKANAKMTMFISGHMFAAISMYGAFNGISITKEAASKIADGCANLLTRDLFGYGVINVKAANDISINDMIVDKLEQIKEKMRKNEA